MSDDSSSKNKVSESELDALADLIGVDDDSSTPDAPDPQQLIDQATAEAQAVAADTGAAKVDAKPPISIDLPQMTPDLSAGGLVSGIDLLKDVNLDVKIELGRQKMLVEDVLRLGEGSVVELDKLAGDPVDVFVNDRLVARGEVLVYNDDFCVRVNEIISDSIEDMQ